MKKTKLLGATAIIAAGFLAGIFGFKTSESKSALALANIEALATDENDCHNTNGYRQWNTSGKLFQRESEFYDCCTKDRNGYSPNHDCK